eukprot:4861118-Prymnesium_polylepis.2
MRNGQQWEAVRVTCILDCTIGFSTDKHALGACCEVRRLCNSRTKPSIPAAGSRCPKLGFVASSQIAVACAPRARLTSAKEPTSVGSPSKVPLPWASIRAHCSKYTAASSSATVSSTTCALPLGAVRLELRPSCRTALPFSSTGLHLCLCVCNLRSIAATPSPLT